MYFLKSAAKGAFLFFGLLKAHVSLCQGPFHRVSLSVPNGLFIGSSYNLLRIGLQVILYEQGVSFFMKPFLDELGFLAQGITCM